MRFKHHNVVGEIDNLPGCSQIGVFHSVFVPPNQRSSGWGTQAHIDRVKEARNLGYDVAVCTVNEANIAEIKILESNGWEKCFDFLSSKTGHRVCFYSKGLQ